jgi:hypothetical protein
MNMKFTHKQPQTWQELQNLTAEYLTVAGYKATTPYELNTARGKVEVDVYVEAPNELVKHIICECKYWGTPVTKEKIHAFRTVVHDCGAELGIIISKNGYQFGAIEAAAFSNVRLETWESFLNIIMDKWIDNRLWAIKVMAARVMSFSDGYTYRSEELTAEEYPLYQHECNSALTTTKQCMLILKSDLLNDGSILDRFEIQQQYQDIETYLNELFKKLQEALEVLEKLSVKPDKPDRFISTMKIYMENADD